MRLSEQEIYAHLRQTMWQLFEVDEEAVVQSARLYDDLDIDSIDAVNLIIELKRITGVPIHAERFREARTVGDVVETITGILAEHESRSEPATEPPPEPPTEPTNKGNTSSLGSSSQR